tara:strand:+ start:249 stop:521 length:273 start_codon:yes stop_codon:yes gene_type:complete
MTYNIGKTKVELITSASNSGNGVTGSIEKAIVVNHDSGTLSRIEFGSLSTPFTATSVINEEITFKADQVIDGNIGRLKVLSGSFLIYKSE